MMSFLEWIKNFFAPDLTSNSADDYSDNDESESADDYEEDDEPQNIRRQDSSRESDSREKDQNHRPISIQATTQLEVVLVKPEEYSDSKAIADHLIQKKTVVLNLETATAENKRRIVDFLAGVAYASGGSFKQIANLTYIITPYNVGFVGDDIVGELENNGIVI